MYRQPPKLIYLSLVLVLVFALGACAVDTQPDGVVAPEVGVGDDADVIEEEPEVVEQQPGMQPGQFPGVMEAPNALHTASSLLDYNVESTAGDFTAEIDDLLIDMQTGRIHYAVLEHGGVLDIGDSEFAVPMHALTWASDNQLSINIDQQSLENYPELGADWPNFDDQAWDDNLNEFWTNLGFGDETAAQTDVDQQFGSMVRLSNLMDMDTGDLGFGTGNVEDVLLDLQQGIAKFVLLDYGEGLGENELVAVPFDAFDPQSIQSDELAFSPDFDSEWLQSAPRFDRDMLTESASLEPTFDDDVEAYWQEQGLLGATVIDDGTTPATTTDGMVSSGTAGVAGAQNALISASALLDYNFENIDGEVSGEIEDFLVDVNTGRILYATLEYGGFLDIGDTELPVPLSVFTLGEGGDELVLNIPEETLDALPDLGDDWADPINTATWDDEVNTFWANEGFDPGFDVTAESGPVMWGSQLINNYGVGDVGFGASNVRDMLVDLEQGHVRYAVLDFGGVGTYGAAFGNELAIVPFEALNMTDLTAGFGFDEGFDLSIIENAPRIVDPTILGQPTLLDPSIAEDIDRYWEEQGFAF